MRWKTNSDWALITLATLTIVFAIAAVVTGCWILFT